MGSLQLLEENEAPLGQSVDDNFRTENLRVRDFDLKNFTYREGDIVALVCVEKYLIKNEWIQRSGYRASEETKNARTGFLNGCSPGGTREKDLSDAHEGSGGATGP